MLQFRENQLVQKIYQPNIEICYNDEVEVVSKEELWKIIQESDCILYDIDRKME